MISKARATFLLWARVTLVLVYMVILAGSVVRATGSGMGCPDWPKCFGHYIPPTQLEQLQFSEGKHFNKGHFIIWQRALWKAKHDITAGAEINPADWEKYTKHDYARFNAMHTWTEYINRLSGATLGIGSLIMLIMSFRLRRDHKILPLLSAITVLLIGFEAWLGATVVESNLEPAKITTHMIVAIIIIAVMLSILSRARFERGVKYRKLGSLTALLFGLGIAATIIQIIIGTQVREGVDALDQQWNGELREQWVSNLGSMFQVHRIFAYAVILINGALVYRIRKDSAIWRGVRSTAMWLMALLVLEWVTGVILAEAGLPAYIQPAHLVIATVIFGFQFKLLGDVRRPPQLEEPTGSEELEATAAPA